MTTFRGQRHLLTAIVLLHLIILTDGRRLGQPREDKQLFSRPRQTSNSPWGPRYSTFNRFPQQSNYNTNYKRKNSGFAHTNLPSYSSSPSFSQGKQYSASSFESSPGSSYSSLDSASSPFLSQGTTFSQPTYQHNPTFSNSGDLVYSMPFTSSGSATSNDGQDSQNQVYVNNQSINQSPNKDSYLITYPEKDTGKQYYQGETLVINDFTDTYSSYAPNKADRNSLNKYHVTEVFEPFGTTGIETNEFQASGAFIPEVSYLPPASLAPTQQSNVAAPETRPPSSLEAQNNESNLIPLLLPLVPAAKPNQDNLMKIDEELSSASADEITPNSEAMNLGGEAEDASIDILALDFGQDDDQHNGFNVQGANSQFEPAFQAVNLPSRPTSNDIWSNSVEAQLGQSDTNYVLVSPNSTESSCPEKASCVRWTHCKQQNGKFAGMCGFGDFNVCCMLMDEPFPILVENGNDFTEETINYKDSTSPSEISDTTPMAVIEEDPMIDEGPFKGNLSALTPLSDFQLPILGIALSSATTESATELTTIRNNVVDPNRATESIELNPGEPLANDFYSAPLKAFEKPVPSFVYSKFTSASSEGNSYHHTIHKYPSPAPHTSRMPDFGAALYSQGTVSKLSVPVTQSVAKWSTTQGSKASPTPTMTATTTPSPQRTRFKVRPFGFDTDRFGTTRSPVCSAALICVPKNRCSLLGKVMEAPQHISENIRLYSGVPLITCQARKNLGALDELHVCCQDPSYVDPWP